MELTHYHVSPQGAHETALSHKLGLSLTSSHTHAHRHITTRALSQFSPTKLHGEVFDR